MKIKNKLKMSLKGLAGAVVLSGLFLASPMPATAGSPVKAAVEEGWTLLSENGDVKAYAQITNCGNDGKAIYLVKLVNTNKLAALEVEYSIAVSNHPGLGTYKSGIKLAPGSSENGMCENELMLKAEAFGDNPVLENLEFQILTVKNLSDEK